MADSVSSLLSLLDIETLDVDLYLGEAPKTDVQRVFGGHVAAQALVAAVRTVDEKRQVHSLHSYFLRPGDPKHNIIFHVDRIREGRSFTTRRVVAKQQGKAIFHLSVSFQIAEDGPEHADPMPDVPSPDELQTMQQLFAGAGVDWKPPFPEWSSVDLRYVTPANEVARARSGRLQAWFRALDHVPEVPHLHVCVLTYMSDMSLLGTTITPHGGIPGNHNYRMASLDHAMWFHRPFRADEWLLYDMRSSNAFGARGLAHGQLFTEGGTLVATVMQEGLIRPMKKS
ncbi:acyl-CoA thioesterase [Euzebya tangerina]|uniref:acyl-CoA thioesterase n=1 Tax=Euzebya tangerina TaxID=591198 RepID=UPI000E30EBA5|nr:acyl-CoA thioesterase II [Euzebya tangerina]